MTLDQCIASRIINGHAEGGRTTLTNDDEEYRPSSQAQDKQETDDTSQNSIGVYDINTKILDRGGFETLTDGGGHTSSWY